MNIDSAYPSKFLKSADIEKGKKVRYTISHVDVEDVSGEGEMRPILYFTGAPAGLVLNKTNKEAIKLGYGKETDDWHGKPLFLFCSVTQYQGKTVDCLRVEVPMVESEAPPF